MIDAILYMAIGKNVEEKGSDCFINSMTEFRQMLYIKGYKIVEIKFDIKGFNANNMEFMVQLLALFNLKEGNVSHGYDWSSGHIICLVDDEDEKSFPSTYLLRLADLSRPTFFVHPNEVIECTFKYFKKFRNDQLESALPTPPGVSEKPTEPSQRPPAVERKGLKRYRND